MSKVLVNLVSGESSLPRLQRACLLPMPHMGKESASSIVSLLIRALISRMRAPPS